ncbi:MAG TPA: hypothetical protein VGL56_12490 [Fimbriimonadaceae bacterium]|jgi:hypothetical protein
MSAEKKKLFIVGLLAFIVLCVGVFQFTGGSKKEAAAKPGTKAPKTLAATQPSGSTEALANAQGHPPTGANVIVPGASTVAAAEPDLAERDPFDGQKYLPTDEHAKSAATAPAAAPHAKAPHNIMPVTPFNDGNALPPPGGKINLNSLTQQPKDVFEYTVSGVVTGERSAAIFQDSKGNQRLIQLGGSLDGDTKVVSIDGSKVTVSHHGKNITLTVGADNPTEKRSDEK